MSSIFRVVQRIPQSTQLPFCDTVVMTQSVLIRFWLDPAEANGFISNCGLHDVELQVDLAHGKPLLDSGFNLHLLGKKVDCHT